MQCQHDRVAECAKDKRRPAPRMMLPSYGGGDGKGKGDRRRHGGAMAAARLTSEAVSRMGW